MAGPIEAALLPLAPLVVPAAPMTDVMAAAKAAVKFGSVVIAAVTVSTIDCCCGRNGSDACGPTNNPGSFCGRPYMESGTTGCCGR